MAQLGRFSYPVQDTSGNAISGASVSVFREGATVNGNQSGASPTTFTVRHRGKIVTGDNVFVNADTGTLYAATVVSATQIALGGYVGTLSLTSGDRLTPSGSQPTLYADDQGGATTSNPLTSSNTGRVSCWMEYGAYDLVLSGGGLTATAFTSEVMPTEAPGQIRFAGSFGLTVAGVQLAIDECEAQGGGWVMVPQAAGILITNTSIKIGKGVTLKSTGERIHTTATFVANASTNVSAMIENKFQDGTQQFAGIEGIQVDGQKASGAVVTAGIKLVGVFINSRIRDVDVFNTSGYGIQLGTSALGLGGLLIQNTTVSGTGDHGIIISGSSSNTTNNIRLDKVEADNPGVGKAGVYFDNSAVTQYSQGHVITDLYCDSYTDANQVGLLIDSCRDVSVHGMSFNTASTAYAIKILNTAGLSEGGSGVVVQNLRSSTINLLNDVVNGVNITNATSNFLSYYKSPRSGATSRGAVVGLQHAKDGGSVTSAATLNINVEGNSILVTGVNNVTAIAAAGLRDTGRVVYLRFNGILTFTHGNNIFLAGAANFVTANNSLLTLVSPDGSNWYEVARKA